jgi:hypothetical protein
LDKKRKLRYYCDIRKREDESFDPTQRVTVNINQIESLTDMILECCMMSLPAIYIKMFVQENASLGFMNL